MENMKMEYGKKNCVKFIVYVYNVHNSKSLNKQSMKIFLGLITIYASSSLYTLVICMD